MNISFFHLFLVLENIVCFTTFLVFEAWSHTPGSNGHMMGRKYFFYKQSNNFIIFQH